VDLYLIHSPYGGRLLETWDALLYLQKFHASKVRSIGVSNFGIAHLEVLRVAGRPMPTVNQIEMHPLVYRQRKDLLDYCAEHEIVVQAFGSLMHGYEGLLESRVLIDMAERYNHNHNHNHELNGNGNGNGNGNESVRTSDRIRCLVTMGAIHKVPEKESTCVTRGALKYTDENYPGAFLKDEGIGYVSIGGSAIVGDERKDDEKDNDGDDDDNDDDDNKIPELMGSEADDYYKRRGEGNSNRVAFTSYKAVSGNGNLIGDGVVPLEWTQLEGSRTIVLPDVLHSINEAGTTFPTDRWYGSEKVIDRWLPVVLEEADLKQTASGLDFDFAGGLQKWASNLIGN